MTSRLRHRSVSANGIRIHLAEQGEGPMVLLVHGFPESRFSWRHQMPALADAGYRAVAIDVRGYGRSSKPTRIDDYRMLQHVADNLGVVTALGEERAVVVGHDWGSPIAAHSALLRPDVFHAVVLMSVPYGPRSGRSQLATLAGLAPEGEELYMSYYQEPGRAEAEIEEDVRHWLTGFYVGASAQMQPSPDGVPMAFVKRGGKQRDRFVIPDELPAWLTPDDLDVYVGEFERSGFAGALNRYRNMDADWADMAPWQGEPITVPSLFIGGDRDGPTIWGASAIARFPKTMPGIRGTHVLEGCGHWVQQEKPEETNRLLLDFLSSLELERPAQP